VVAFLAILGLGGWRCDALGRSADDDSSIYLLVALAAVLPPGLQYCALLLIVLITSFIGWAGLARVIRGQVLSIKARICPSSTSNGRQAVLHHPPRFAADG